MMNFILNILVLLLVVNGLFWSLATHKQHCSLVDNLKISKCAKHYIHIAFGMFSLFLAIVIKQRAYLF